MKYRDALWLWGHGRQVDNIKIIKNPNMRGRPGFGRLSTAEAARNMGISNICRIALESVEFPPFDNEVEECRDMEQIAWSVLGCGVTNCRNDLEEVLRLARKYPNITAGVMDDFFPPANSIKMHQFPPSSLRIFADRLHNELDHRLDLWIVVYTSNLDYDIKPYLDCCDVVTLWTWDPEHLSKLDENYKKLRSICGDNKKVMAGCYMWDFSGECPIPIETMEYQIDTYNRWLSDGKIEGIIFCHNYLVDLQIEAVKYTKNWIAQLKDIDLPGTY